MISVPVRAIAHLAAQRAAAAVGTAAEYDRYTRAISDVRRQLAADPDTTHLSEYLSQLSALARARRALLPAHDQLRRLEESLLAEHDISHQGAAGCG